MIWNDHSRDFKTGDHAFLSPSTYAWINYTPEKLFDVYINKLASSRGTALHALAAEHIKLGIPLADEQTTLNMYVNDALHYNMSPEVKLYYSRFCFGTADAISADSGMLRIHDLKTGFTKASFVQLKIYAALFFLDYDYIKPGEMEIELRIYQNDEVRVEHSETDEIVPIMDQIIRYSRYLTQLEEKYDDGFDSFRSRS